MNRETAKNLEEKLFYECTKVDQKSILYKKYHEEKRDKPYKPSHGGSPRDGLELECSVYMAWWNK
jgi:hypothetical protein